VAWADSSSCQKRVLGLKLAAKKGILQECITMPNDTFERDFLI
jgi:hypothetical protein